jgi:hypothetical protein
VVNLKLDTEVTRLLGVENHVCEVQLVLKSVAYIEVTPHTPIEVTPHTPTTSRSPPIECGPWPGRMSELRSGMLIL